MNKFLVDVISVFLIGFFIGSVITVVHFKLPMSSGVVLASYIATMCGSLAIYLLANK